MQKIIIVGFGGFVGASFRYIFSGLFVKYVSQTYPYGTLFVNILGALLIGFIMEISIDFNYITPTMRLLLTTGMLGGLTTFSTFSYETISMMTKGSYFMGTVNVVLNVSLSLFAVVTGRYLAQLL